MFSEKDGIEVEYWTNAAGTGHYFYYAFPVTLSILFILLRNRRIRFLIPSLLITIVIVNPIFYEKWSKLGLYAYWRVLWIIPVVPIVAATLPAITEKINLKWTKEIIGILGIIAIIFAGSFVYNTARGQFETPAADNSKLPKNVVQVANRLLELEEHPRVIVENPLGVYIRQYTGEIDTLFGRDVDGGYILHPNSKGQIINEILNDPNCDLKIVSQMMLDEGIDYLVISQPDRARTDDMELIDTVADYYIYRPLGKPAVIKNWNELDQIVSITTIDHDGYPAVGNNGYTTALFSYDTNGYISREYHTDENGAGVLDNRGIAGLERLYDAKGNIIREFYLGKDGMPISDFNTIAGYEHSYDAQGRQISERTIDKNGNPKNNTQGCAEVRWYYDGKDRIIRAEYYNEDRALCNQAAGFAIMIQEYDDEGDPSIRSYYDANYEKVDRAEGFSKVEWLNNEKSKVMVLLDKNGNEKSIEGVNIANVQIGVSGYSNWLTPEQGMRNQCFTIGTVNLGDKHVGDKFTCQVEIEFWGVKAFPNRPFLFLAQGSQDGKWITGNVWNENLVKLTDAPRDGRYEFILTQTIDEGMEDISLFELGFRCDSWAEGSFRVTKVKIEKGNEATEWTPGI